MQVSSSASAQLMFQMDFTGDSQYGVCKKNFLKCKMSFEDVKLVKFNLINNFAIEKIIGQVLRKL